VARGLFVLAGYAARPRRYRSSWFSAEEADFRNPRLSLPLISTEKERFAGHSSFEPVSFVFRARTCTSACLPSHARRALRCGAPARAPARSQHLRLLPCSRQTCLRTQRQRRRRRRRPRRRRMTPWRACLFAAGPLGGLSIRLGDCVFAAGPLGSLIKMTWTISNLQSQRKN